MSDHELDPDLEAFAERLDRAFSATTPPAGFQEELWGRLPRRRFGAPWLDATRLAGIAAAFVVVFGAGYLLTHAGHGGGASTASYQPQSGNAPRAAAPGGGRTAQSAVAAPDRAFGRVPRPQVAPAPARPATGTVTASLAMPATAAVERYLEPTAIDADGFASRVSAHRSAAAANTTALPVYSGDGFSLSVFPTNAPAGLVPTFVLTPQGGPTAGGAPDVASAELVAKQFLLKYNLQPPAGRLDATATPNQPTVVRYVAQVQGYDQVARDGTPVGLTVTVQADGSVLQASGPLPIPYSSSMYPLAPLADLVRQAAAATTATLDHAALVYVLAFDGQYGYLEPAVLFSGGGASVLVPALAPDQLR